MTRKEYMEAVQKFMEGLNQQTKHRYGAVLIVVEEHEDGWVNISSTSNVNYTEAVLCFTYDQLSEDAPENASLN